MSRLGGALAVVAALAVVGGAHAAGGHHAVDDASIIAPGQCELESWFTRESGGTRALHAGVGCRVGPVELAGAADHARAGGSSSTGYGLQVKWAREFWPGVSAGLSVGTAWQAHARPRHQGTSAAALLSWAVNDSLAVHANLGRDFVKGQPDAPRSGVAVDWAPLSPQWRLIAERYLADGTHSARVGLRWFPGEAWMVDVSRARSLHGAAPSSWTIGATYTFDR